MAGELVHEVQHVDWRHSLRIMINAVGWAALLAVVLGDVGAVAGVLIHQAGAMRFSRELEAQADLHGLAGLPRAGLPVSGMVTFFRRLQKKEEKGSVPLLSSRPATAERVARLESDMPGIRRRGLCRCDSTGPHSSSGWRRSRQSTSPPGTSEAGRGHFQAN